MEEAIEIRPAASTADYRACQEAQRLAWGIADDAYLVPIATMVGAQLHGGLVLGAFLADGRAAGVSFAFLGRAEGVLCLYSQLTGVIPGYQSRGLGERMKYAQREFARDQSIPLLAWAFDPFQPGNARFNLHKLGATAGRYVEDMYGSRTDALNAGVPTDRLIVTWESDRRREPIPISSTMPRVIVTGVEPVAREAFRPEREPVMLLEIPGSRIPDERLAAAWRTAVRRGFQAAFSAGYRAVDFLREPGDNRGYYVLHHEGNSSR